MCQFFSAIITKDSILFDKNIDQHEELVRLAKLDDATMNPDFVRVEITPIDKDVFNHNPNNWKFKIDQDLIPDWLDKAVAEERTRKALDEVLKEVCFINYNDVVRDYSRIFVKNSTVEACRNSIVYAYGNSTVCAYDSSSVYARDNSSVKANSKSCVYASDTSIVEAHDKSSIYAYNNSFVHAHDNSSVHAGNNSSVKAYGKSSVYARGNSTVHAYNNSIVYARDNSSVHAHDNSSIHAYGKSSVEAYGDSSVHAYDNSTIKAKYNSYIFKIDKTVNIVEIADKAIVRDDKMICVSMSSGLIVNYLDS